MSGLTEGEKVELWRMTGPRFEDLVSAVEGILAARSAQQAPAADLSERVALTDNDIAARLCTPTDAPRAFCPDCGSSGVCFTHCPDSAPRDEPDGGA